MTSKPATSQLAMTSISDRLARMVVQYRLVIVVGWILLALFFRLVSPDWKSIAYDGDFDYLPASMSSVAGERLLDQAFPTQRSRSQVVLVISRDGEVLDVADEVVSLDLLRRLSYRLAELHLARTENGESDKATEATAQDHLEKARVFLDETILLDQLYFDALTELGKEDLVPQEQLRLAMAYWDRGNVLRELDEEELAASDTQAALTLSPDIAATTRPYSERELAGWSSLIDLRNWKDAIIGSRMSKPEARLAILLSDAELAATSNIEFLGEIDELKESVLKRHQGLTRPGLQILATGSAAIGGETLIAARDAIRYTEVLTVVLILVILALVYRAPLLVAIPVLSIAIAIMVSGGLVAWLTIASRWAESPWLDVKVFTTSRIFVVVILFGSGTDFCLFIISRLREEALRWSWDEACVRSLSGVSGALVGSALTTIVGLGMLWIAEFGKFSYTGPVIGLCLAIGLLVCLTFTPALLSLIGPKAFWPSVVQNDGSSSSMSGAAVIGSRDGERATGTWGLIALSLTRYPGLALIVGFALLFPPAIFGYMHEDEVTYDISSQLDESAQSRRGLQVLERHFAIGEINPTTVLITLPQDSDPAALRENATTLAQSLYGMPGVTAVRSADDPLGDFPPDRSMSLLSADAWRRRALKTHRIAKDYFFSASPEYENRLARLDVVVSGDPFDINTADRVDNIRDWLEDQAESIASPWYGAQVLLTGTTPSIIDLRTVTLSDNRKIKVAVILAVFAALWVVIRRVSLCSYLIATVLLSYYATFGFTVLFFRFAYGDGYLGLDWKLPLFLFVILVAVGQDYNVYLVTRIIEEQRERGWLSALRRAVARTGGIITACGLVMAATFFSMTASAWLPTVTSLWSDDVQRGGGTLRGIVELGFALGLGVLIDTFYVRTILVPSFVAVLDRLRNGPRLPSLPEDSDHGAKQTIRSIFND
jgi:RND superfamily putative drug exporter